MARHPSSGGSAGEILRSARRAAGLSAREVARRAALPSSSVTELERGREPRLDTLDRLVAVLPGLEPGRLLGRPQARAAASRGAWEGIARTVGFHGEHLTFTARVSEGDARRVGTTLEVEGVRHDRLSLTDPDVRAALMQGIFEGSGRALMEIEARDSDLEGGPLRLEEEGFVHEFSFPRPLDARGLSYRRERSPTVQGSPEAARLPAPWAKPFRLGAALWVRHPVRRLSLVVEVADDAPRLDLVARAWPAHLGADPSEAIDCLPSLHPDTEPCRLSADEGRARLDVDFPVVGLCYGIGWEPAASQEATPAPAQRLLAPPRSRAERVPPAVALRRARGRTGASRREVARRMGVSPATVVQVEKGGRAPRLATARAWLRALPELDPHALLAPWDSDEAFSHEQAWRHQCDVHPVLAREERLTVTVGADGTLDYDVLVRDFVTRPFGQLALLLRHGLVASRRSLAAPTLQAVEATGAEPTIRIVDRDERWLLHEMRFGADCIGKPVSYRRTLRAARPLPMDRELSPMVITAITRLPSQRLVLELRFPEGLWPERFVTACAPAVVLPLRGGTEDLTPRLPKGLVATRADRQRGLLRVSMKQPLIGLQVAIGLWPLMKR